MQVSTITRQWEIKRKSIPIPTLTSNEPMKFTGSPITVSLLNYDSNEITLGGTYQATVRGTYTLTMTPSKNHAWPDGSIDSKSLSWTIAGLIPVDVPSQVGTLTYNGNAQSPNWTDYDSTTLTLGGVTTGTNAGTYTATFTPKDGYCWDDETQTAKNVSWSINNAVISTVPSQSGSLTYTGSAQSPTWNNYNTVQLSISGTTSSTDAGTFVATFTPTANYQWSDGSTTAKSVNWTLGRATISTVPTQSGTLTYSGSAQSPAWSNYNSTRLTLGGTTSGTDAGSYTATFTPTSNYQWSNNVITAKNVSWSIGKAAGTLSISPTSLSFTGTGTSNKKTVTVTSSNSGTASASSNKTSIATVSTSGKTVTVTPVAAGSATVTIGMPTDTNYLATSTKTCSVTISPLYSGTSKAATAAQFQQVIKAGQGPNQFVVGDFITVPIKGTVGLLSLDDTYLARIIGFNHNQPTEGTGDYVDVMFGWTRSTQEFRVWADKYAGNIGTDSSFVMCTPNTFKENYADADGYNNSLMCQTRCNEFYNAIDASWRDTIIPATKYTVNSGNGATDDPALVTGFPYKIWLLAEFELVGMQNDANSAEKDFQQQYSMANGFIGYSIKPFEVAANGYNTSYSVRMWFRSPVVNREDKFCAYQTSYGLAAGSSQGFAPCCRIG